LVTAAALFGCRHPERVVAGEAVYLQRSRNLLIPERFREGVVKIGE
jgi:hypothetical protein